MEALDYLLTKYQLLLALSDGEPGRSTGRREAMRRIARDYPAALREWEELPLDELRRRCALLQRLQAAAAERPAVADSLLAGSEPWVGYCLALHQALRRRLDERRLDPQPTEAGRRLSELALAEVAERYAVAPSDVKAAIFTPPKG